VSGQESLLGAHHERVRTDVRMPPNLAKQVGVVCKRLGIPRNAFFTIAACNELIKLSDFLTSRKKDILLKELDEIVQKIREKAS